MKTNPRPNHQRGALLLAVLAIIALVAIVWLGWKIIQKLDKWRPDPNHGQGTNAVDNSWAPRIAELQASNPGVTLNVSLPEFNLTVPLEALAWQWHETVQTSTNLSNWTDVDMDWSLALDDIQTNHNLPCRYYRRILWW